MSEPAIRNTWPFRSLLFVPGHKADWVDKALRHDPEALILDLEDSVPPNDKVASRDIVRNSLDYLYTKGVGGFVRINSMDKGAEGDVEGIMSKGLTAVCLPKLDNVQNIRDLHDFLSYAEGKAGLPRGYVSIIGIPETAKGMADIRELAEASPRVKGFMSAIIDRVADDAVFTGDTALAHGFIPTRGGMEQAYFTSMLCLQSRAGGAPFPLATIIGTDLNDPETARPIAERIKSTGFTGCVCIHPSHVKIANEVFRPSQKDVDFAVGVLEAMYEGEKQGLWAVRYRGMMVDVANVELAENVIAEARRRGMNVPDSPAIGRVRR